MIEEIISSSNWKPFKVVHPAMKIRASINQLDVLYHCEMEWKWQVSKFSSVVHNISHCACVSQFSSHRVTVKRW